jgi:multiple sugar transport system ATP-binding protein
MLSEEWEPKLNEYLDRPLLLGIRPEHLSLGLPATKNFHGSIETVEALGNDTYIAVRVSDLDLSTEGAGVKDLILQVRVSPDKEVKIGEEVWLSVATDKIHIFDRETTLALRL